LLLTEAIVINKHNKEEWPDGHLTIESGQPQLFLS